MYAGKLDIPDLDVTTYSERITEEITYKIKYQVQITEFAAKKLYVEHEFTLSVPSFQILNNVINSLSFGYKDLKVISIELVQKEINGKKYKFKKK